MTQSRSGDSFQPGDLLNNTYRIEEILGRGGTSEVYLAKSEISGRRVAVKALKSELSTNDDYLVLMTREEDVRDIRHEAVVRYYDNQRTPEGLVYLVMDYIEGPGLDKKMQSGPMPVHDILTLAERVAGGLVAAHQRKIIHRDLSPDNIILKNGDPAQAIIIDFGIAKDTNPGAETIVGNEFAGKYAYAAPEQLSGTTDERSDIYSLGAVLLAAFRGKTPDVGNNPMEVVSRKSQVLDTSGVPEPLKTLIDRMTTPDPDDRLQSAAHVIEALGGDIVAPVEALSDATVIAAPPQSAARKDPAPEKGRGGLFAIIGVVALALVGAGGWFGGFFDGLLGPRLPMQDPFALVIEKSGEKPPIAVGYVPSEDMQAALADLMNLNGGTVQVELATGPIAETWGDDVIELADLLSLLDEFRIDMANNSATITGLANDRRTHTMVTQSLSGDGVPPSLNAAFDIELGPRFLSRTAVEGVLEQNADCGALELVQAPDLNFGTDTGIVVTGKLASNDSRQALMNALRDISGSRPVAVDAEILNPALCLLESALPDAPFGGFRVNFGFGGKSIPNPSGRYLVGENPVIDVVIPPTVRDGFIWVSVLDVSGNVFHLLPNISRPENSVAALREGQSGGVPIRVAYGMDEVTDASQLAFVVDGASLGKSKIVILHSDGPVFDDLRPTTESAGGFAQALRERTANGGARILSLDRAILETAQP